MTPPLALGPRLRHELTPLATLYRPMAASPTLAAWLAWPRSRWESLWRGMEAATELERTGRARGGLGCPFTPLACQPDAPVVCQSCAGPLVTTLQEKML